MLACAALVVLAWRLVPAGSPPIYDGLCIASPYQLLGGNPPPTAASKSYPAGGNFPTSEIVTNENPPQVQVLMTDGTFVSPQSPFTVTVTPVAPPAAPPPAGMAIDGNVVEIKAVTDSGQLLQPEPQHPLTVLLRATSSTPPRTLFRLDGTSWTGLKTFNAGCGDTYEAVSDHLGDFALMSTPSGGGNGGSNGGGGGGGGGGGFPTALLVAVLIVVVLGSTIGLLRVNRTRRR
jgi:hypothetical protein